MVVGNAQQTRRMRTDSWCVVVVVVVVLSRPCMAALAEFIEDFLHITIGFLVAGGAGFCVKILATPIKHILIG